MYFVFSSQLLHECHSGWKPFESSIAIAPSCSLYPVGASYLPMISVTHVMRCPMLHQSTLALHIHSCFRSLEVFLMQSGCIGALIGPMPVSFLDFSEDLTKRILNRARSLGMTPVLPAFSGHVPDGLESRFPAKEFSRLPRWSGFSNAHSALLFVEPSSGLYVRCLHGVLVHFHSLKFLDLIMR